MNTPKPRIIGELMNNSYARARRAWQDRNLDGYRFLARLQTELGAAFLTLNVDSTHHLAVTFTDMLEFLPKVIPAIQDATALPLSFDNPNLAFHVEAMKHFDPAKANGRPILNSLSVTRHDIDGMIELAGAHDMNVIIMASECLRPDGSYGAAETPADIVRTTRYFADRLHERAGITNDRIIVDPGLPPIASDTHGGVNLCLDAIRALRAEPSLSGMHISVGLSNFANGAPKHLRIPLERAFLRIAMKAGLDFALANPEKNTDPMRPFDPLVVVLERILDEGRPQPGEAAEDAGFRQLDALMELWSSM
jgi:5-methyltetrahydrofolate--homocysteine methyltransferase